MHKSIAPISLLALLAVNPAQAAPTQIAACGTISEPGSYVLARNLSPLSGDCLVIAAYDVTVDLAGFAITGTGTGAGITRARVPLSPGGSTLPEKITVRNGTITGFHSGVDLNGGALAFDVVERLRVTTSFGPDEDVNGGIGISASGIVRDNQVFAGGKAGGITAAGRVTGNFASSVNGTAITVFARSTVIGNTVFGGLTVSCPSNVTDNTSNRNLVLSGEGCNNTNNVAP